MPIGNCSRPDDANWTGAEIKSCCRLASLLDVPLVQAAQNVVPVAETAGDKIEALRPDRHGVHRPRPSAGELYSLPSPILPILLIGGPHGEQGSGRLDLKQQFQCH